MLFISVYFLWPSSAHIFFVSFEVRVCQKEHEKWNEEISLFLVQKENEIHV